MGELSNGYGLNVEMHTGARSAMIYFQLPCTSYVLLRVMNGDDKEVRLLINETMPEGRHFTTFAFGNLQPDCYIIRLIINSEDTIDIETLNIKIH